MRAMISEGKSIQVATNGMETPKLHSTFSELNLAELDTPTKDAKQGGGNLELHLGALSLVNLLKITDADIDLKSHIMTFINI